MRRFFDKVKSSVGSAGAGPAKKQPTSDAAAATDSPLARAKASSMHLIEERDQAIANLKLRKSGGRVRTESVQHAMLQETVAKDDSTFEVLLEALAEHPVLKSRSATQRLDMARYMRRAEFSDGEVVFDVGDFTKHKDDRFFVCVEGAFEVATAPADAEGPQNSTPNLSALPSSPNVLASGATLSVGKWFGDSALFSQPRACKIVARGSNCVCYYLISSQYQEITVKEHTGRAHRYTRFLRSVEILKQLTEEQLYAVSTCLTQKRFRAGERILEQGTIGDEFFFVESGTVEAYQRTRKGDKEIVSLVNTISEGSYFGEGSLIGKNEPRSADVYVRRLDGKPPVDSETSSQEKKKKGSIMSFANRSNSTSSKKEGDAVVLVLHKDDFVDLLGQLAEILDRNFIARTLKGVELLAPMTASERNELATHLETKKFLKGETIIKQGAMGDELFIIKEGEVLFKRTDPDTGAEEEIGRLFKGSVFGEGSLLTDSKERRATGTAASDVTALTLHRSVFELLFQQSLTELLNRDYTKRKENDVDFADLQSVGVLGAGTYGQVMLVSHKVTGKTYALKIMSKRKIRQLDQSVHVENEKSILESVNFPYVVGLERTYANDSHIFTLMETVMGGELFAYMKKKGRLSPVDARFYIAQVVLVFEYLHSLEVIFRDLKPENILLRADGYIKLADFGLAKALVDGKTFTLCGTPAYAAPEVYKLIGHARPVDWWGLGVLVHELIAGATPFDGDAAAIFSLMEKYARAYPNIKLPRGLQGSSAGDLCLSLLHPNPQKRLGGRIGASAVKQHPFFSVAVEDSVDQPVLFSFPAVMRAQRRPPYVPQIDSSYKTSNFYEPTHLDEKVVDIDKLDTAKVKVVPFGQPFLTVDDEV